jgi:[protein-PII] uridylyltransferase
VLSAADFNILHAYAFTRSDGKVIDVFNVEEMTQSSSWEDVLGRMDQMRETLQRVFDGKLDLAEATAQHAAKWRRRVRTGIPIKVKVQFENDVSDDFTIIDIFAADRPGLLHDVTRALSEQNLRISRAKISTEANRVIDSFYVTDSRGQKCAAPEKLRKLRKVLEEVVAFERSGRSNP